VPSPDVMAMARRLLDAAGFVSISSFEAKRHAVTGEHVLMEINVRTPQAIGLGEAPGVDAHLRHARRRSAPAPASTARPRARGCPQPRGPSDRGLRPSGRLSVRDLLRSYRGVQNISGLTVTDPGPLAAFTLALGSRASRLVAREFHSKALAGGLTLPNLHRARLRGWRPGPRRAGVYLVDGEPV
jgi:predicted ATP-grasp superfamily ATP-dependent carboligase